MNTKEYPDVSIEVKKINQIIGPNNAGKSFLCDMLYKGFQGKLKKQFIYNGNIVESKDYFVYYIKDTDTIELEKKLGTKSQLKSRIVSTMDSLDDTVLKLIENKVEEVSWEIENHFLQEVEVFEGLKLKFDMVLKDILLKNISLEINDTILDEISYSNKRISYIELILDTIEKIHQPTILIIDAIDNGLTTYSIQKLLQRIHKSVLDDTIVFFSTNTCSKDYANIYVYRENVSNTLLDDTKVISWIAEKEGCKSSDVKELYTEEEISYIVEKHEIENQVQKCFMSDFTDMTQFIKLLKIK